MMTSRTRKSKQLERLDDVLAAYGANEARWPAAEREVLKRLVRTDAIAARLLREAEALEHVMAFAPAGQAGETLKQRIVASAESDGGREARVVPISAARALMASVRFFSYR